MSQQDKLFALIKALTPTEKSHFSKYARIHNVKDKPDYVRLFEFMDKLETYDEAVILAHFKEEKFIKQLARKKTQLWDKLIDSLSSLHASRTVETSLRKKMNALPILYEKASKDKALVKGYESLIKKIKKEAEKHELFGILIDLFDWERQLLMLLDKASKDRQIVNLLDKRKEQLYRLQEEFELEELNSHSHRIVVRDGSMVMPQTRRNFEDKVVNVFKKYKLDGLSLKAQRYFFFIESCYYRYFKDWKSALKSHKRLLHTYEEGTSNIYATHQYKVHLCNYLVIARITNDMEDYLEIIEKIKKLDSDKNIKIFNTVQINLLVYYLDTYNFKAAIRTSEQILERWDELYKIAPKARLLSYYYNILLAYWLGGDSQTALHWLSKILNFENTDISTQRYHNLARIIQLPIYYDTGDENLENKIESARKMLAHTEALYEYRRIILSGFRKLVKCVNNTEKEDCLMSLHDALLKIKEEEDIKASELDCIILWVQLRLKQPETMKLLEQH